MEYAGNSKIARKADCPLNSFGGDPRIVLTLDAGGTSFRFSATQGGKAIIESPPVPSCGDDLPRCLQTLVDGFAEIGSRCPAPPVAISFAFPGPADYPAGIIGSLPNLPAFRGGVALGPMLSARFGLPVFVNNDGDLFAYGEAMAGFLPYTNSLLAQAGSLKRYHNLLGVTFGTGFGGGIVRRGELFVGDNSSSGEVWLLRNKLEPAANAEEGISIRAIRRVYAQRAGIPFEDCPDPKTINRIARGEEAGDRAAGLEAYRCLGEVAGDALAQALTLVDGLVVIGGGLAKGADLFLPALVDAMNDVFRKPGGDARRLGPRAFNLEDPEQRDRFVHCPPGEVIVPGSGRKMMHDHVARTAVGLTRLGTSEAIALGAYAFALRELDSR